MSVMTCTFNNAQAIINGMRQLQFVGVSQERRDVEAYRSLHPGWAPALRKEKKEKKESTAVKRQRSVSDILQILQESRFSVLGSFRTITGVVLPERG